MQDAHISSAMSVPFVDLRAQYAQIREQVDEQMHEVLDRATFVGGPQVVAFEEAFAAYVGVRHAIGVANGTDALLLALKAFGVGPGDEVITAANTFIATAEAIVHAGARPVFVDIDPRTYTLDVSGIERAITPRTKAVIPVHLYGHPAELTPILEIAHRHGVPVIEDAAQAHGAEYRGRRVGAWGHAACFSFYPTKNLGAFGDAGAVVTNDDRIALTVRKLRDHGSLKKYEHDLIGYNSRLDALQAAVLRVKLKYLDQWNEMRRENARVYDNSLSEVPGIVMPLTLDESKHVYHLYVIRVERGSRDDLQQYLRVRGIQTSIHYPEPLHRTAPLGHLRYQEGDFPVAEMCAKAILSLPMYPGLEKRLIEYVARHVRNYMLVHA